MKRQEEELNSLLGFFPVVYIIPSVLMWLTAKKQSSDCDDNLTLMKVDFCDCVSED